MAQQERITPNLSSHIDNTAREAGRQRHEVHTDSVHRLFKCISALMDYEKVQNSRGEGLSRGAGERDANSNFAAFVENAKNIEAASNGVAQGSGSSI